MEELLVAVPGLVVTDLETRSTTPIESVDLAGVEVDGDYAVILMNASLHEKFMPSLNLQKPSLAPVGAQSGSSTRPATR